MAKGRVAGKRDAGKKDAGLERVLELLRELRNFDFGNYKRATLKRRVDRRMEELRVRSYDAYLARLREEPAEADVLISSMLIKLTSFFRDPELWDTLKKSVLPELIARRRPGQELRIWSAGCATGQEAYSIAFLVADALGSRFSGQEVKIFGTDVDEASVAHARRGVYSQLQLEGLSKEQTTRYFTLGPEGYTVRKDIRRAVVFGANNLVSDAPVSRIDLVFCRNVFIYLDSELQRRVLARFHFALRPQGILVLGKSELIPFASRIFETVDPTRRIYRKSPRQDLTLGLQERLGHALEEEDLSHLLAQSRDKLSDTAHLQGELLTAMPCAMIATTDEGVVTFWNEAASQLWGRREGEVLGKKLPVLGLGGLSGETLVEKSNLVRSRRSECEWADGVIQPSTGAQPVAIRAQILPIGQRRGDLKGLLYVAHDSTAVRTLEASLQRANGELLQANERLSASYEELRAANEELETTNEELQSANEELQTTNEELQSTNEELETTNEELQSTNAELDATNRELAHRSHELDLLTLYQRTIIRALGAAVVVLDPHGRINTWNLAAERLLGLTEREALGQVLWTLHVPALKRALLVRVRKAVELNRPMRLDAIPYELPSGGTGRASVALTPLADGERPLGAVLLFEDQTRMLQAPRAAAGAAKTKPRSAPAKVAARAPKTRERQGA